MTFWLRVDSSGHRWLMTNLGPEDTEIAEFLEHVTEAQIDWFIKALNFAVYEYPLRGSAPQPKEF